MNARAPAPRAALALRVQPLERVAFAPFGEVIEPAAAARVRSINEGSASRYDDLAVIDTDAGQGRTTLGIVRAQPRPLPFSVRMLERHPLGSQAWLPLDPAARYLVVVAASAADTPLAFLAERGQGVNYRRGTWHHPLLLLDAAASFLVIDREGPGANCDEVQLAQAWRIEQRAVQP